MSTHAQPFAFALARPHTALPVTAVRGGGAAGVAIFPSGFGIGDDLVAQMVELAPDVRAVAAFDPFARSDPGFARTSELPRVMARMQALDPAHAQADLRAVVDWLRGEGCGRVVVLGICFGGPFAFAAAADGVADGVVTWHGTGLGAQLARAAAMRCPLRLHFGGADPFVPPAEVAAMRAAFAGRPDVDVVVHPGATHGFSHRAVPEAYDAAAERASLAALRELARGV